MRSLGTLLTESRVPGSDGAVAKKLTVRLHGHGVTAKKERKPGSPKTKYYRRFAGQLVFSKLDFLNGAMAIVPPHLDGRESTADLPAFDLGPEVCPRWLIACLARPSVQKRCKALVRGSRTALRLGVREFLSVEIPLPPLVEQQKIARLLARFDEARAAAREVSVITRQLQTQMLVGFWNQGSSKTCVHDQVLGRLPMGWKALSVEELSAPSRQCVMTGPYGGLLNPADFQPAGVGVLKIGNLTGSGLDLRRLDQVSPDKASTLARYRVEAGDLVIARQGATTGKVALVDEHCQGFLISYHLIRLAIDPERCLPEYLLAYFRSPFVLAQLDVCKAKGTREGVNSKEIRNLRVALPPLAVQGQIVAQARRFSAALAEQEQALFDQDQLQTRVLEDLMTGRVRTTRLT